MGMGVLIFTSLPLVTLRREHVTVDMLEHLIPGFMRVGYQVVLDLVSAAGAGVIGWRVWLKDSKAKPEDTFTVKDGVIETRPGDDAVTGLDLSEAAQEPRPGRDEGGRPGELVGRARRGSQQDRAVEEAPVVGGQEDRALARHQVRGPHRTPDHREQFRGILLAQAANLLVGVGVHHRADPLV